ncbi:hypothetical protein GCM10023238_00540 [Streptomyces heliomycini]
MPCRDDRQRTHVIEDPRSHHDQHDRRHGHDRHVLPVLRVAGRRRAVQVVSRHGTATGSTVWTRCGCGSLQVRAVDDRGARIVSRSRPADAP